jgi:hypothetical protein
MSKVARGGGAGHSSIRVDTKSLFNRKGRPEKDRQDRTARTGQPEQDSQNRTARTGQGEQDSQNMTGRTGQAKQNRLNRTAKAGQAKWDRQNVTEWEGIMRQAERDRQNRTCRTKRDSLSTLASISGLQYMVKVVRGVATPPREGGGSEATQLLVIPGTFLHVNPLDEEDICRH